MPPEPSLENLAPVIPMPTRKQQSWGTIISIVIIVLMIIIGAFYAWGQRISENRVPAPTTSTTTAY